MPADTPDKVRAFLATCNLRRHAWATFERSSRRSAVRALRRITQEADPMPRYEVRTIPGNPTAGPIDYDKTPDDVHYVHDTSRDRPAPGTSTHDRADAETYCAELNARS